MEEFLLSVAGFDPTGGAGILRDSEVFLKFRKKSRAVITSTVIQDGEKVKRRLDTEKTAVREMLIEVTRHGTLKGIKLGVIGNMDTAKTIFNFLKKKKPLNIPIVIDPVLASSDGYPLLDKNAYDFLLTRLFPLATVITPNLKEATILSKKNNIQEAGRFLSSFSLYTVITAGKEMGADFVFKKGKIIKEIKGKIYNKDIHGSGCMYSSTLLVFLSEGMDTITACIKAKQEVETALKESL